MAQQRNIQWFPGHIASAEKALKEQLGSVDVVLEVRDARYAVGASLLPGRLCARRQVGGSNPARAPCTDKVVALSAGSVQLVSRNICPAAMMIGRAVWQQRLLFTEIKSKRAAGCVLAGYRCRRATSSCRGGWATSLTCCC